MVPTNCCEQRLHVRFVVGVAEWCVCMYVSFTCAWALVPAGFVLMTPQLYINYKLQSVAHLPWAMLFYRFVSTFIDDLFAFIITMPMLHRISCLRSVGSAVAARAMLGAAPMVSPAMCSRQRRFDIHDLLVPAVGLPRGHITWSLRHTGERFVRTGCQPRAGRWSVQEGSIARCPSGRQCSALWHPWGR